MAGRERMLLLCFSFFEGFFQEQADGHQEDARDDEGRLEQPCQDKGNEDGNRFWDQIRVRGGEGVQYKGGIKGGKRGVERHHKGEEAGKSAEVEKDTAKGEEELMRAFVEEDED